LTAARAASYDVVVIGAGAAGMMCAAQAGRRGRRVLLIEHYPIIGEKIRISGGGRCNFTNIGSVPERFLSDNPHFCRSALSRYQPADFVALVRKHGIAFHEKTLGQLFCDGSARQIVAMLLAECAAAGVDFRLGHRIADLSRGDAFRVDTDRGAFTAGSLVLATGGLSIPKMGATGLTHDAARRFGLRLTEVRPGLVPLTFDGELLALMRPLAGVSLDTEVTLDRQARERQSPARQTSGRQAAASRTFREATLFTHRGLSGPAILQVSSYWRQGPIRLNLLPNRDPAAFLIGRKRTRPKASLASVLAEALPARLAAALGGSVETRLADVPDRDLLAVATRLAGWEVQPNGSEGYAKAEVTCGGVDTRDLSSRTLAAMDVPGLFVIGEAVDVTGWLGGYNFQWAWASGWCAGEAA
jgi:predicted Rossmann fold flavoprotein